MSKPISRSSLSSFGRRSSLDDRFRELNSDDLENGVPDEDFFDPSDKSTNDRSRASKTEGSNFQPQRYYIFIFIYIYIYIQ